MTNITTATEVFFDPTEHIHDFVVGDVLCETDLVSGDGSEEHTHVYYDDKADEFESESASGDGHQHVLLRGFFE